MHGVYSLPLKREPTVGVRRDLSKDERKNVAETCRCLPRAEEGKKRPDKLVN